MKDHRKTGTEGENLHELFDRLGSLEERIGRLESLIAQEANALTINKQKLTDSSGLKEEDAFISIDKNLVESRFMEFGLAILGTLVLSFGFIFLVIFIQNHWNSLTATLLGYLMVAGAFYLSKRLQLSFRYMSFLIGIGAYLLAYFTTLRLTFFTAAPLIRYKEICVVLLLVVIGIKIYFALKRNSETMGVTSLLMILATAMISDTPHLTLPLIALASVTSFALFFYKNWWKMMITSLILCYIAHALWFIGNPLMGHFVNLVASPHYNLIILFIYGVTYSLVSLVPRKDKFPESVYDACIILNGIFFSAITLLNVLTFYEKTYIPIFTGITLACLGYAIFLKSGIDRRFDPAFFANYGFMALSVAIYGLVKLPTAYTFLAIQSLLVLTMALWFRSKILVIMNTMLFVGILLFYLAVSPSVKPVNFSFALIALVSARIINWKKVVLNLKTELIRNTYLTVAFFMVLFALYHAVDKHYVSLSWSAAAVVYFILSVLIKNIKYRYLALFTLVVTTFYLFLVDLKNMETGFRVVAFLCLALVCLGASLYYTRKLRKKSKQEK